MKISAGDNDFSQARKLRGNCQHDLDCCTACCSDFPQRITPCASATDKRCYGLQFLATCRSSGADSASTHLRALLAGSSIGARHSVPGYSGPRSLDSSQPQHQGSGGHSTQSGGIQEGQPYSWLPNSLAAPFRQKRRHSAQTGASIFDVSATLVSSVTD